MMIRKTLLALALAGAGLAQAATYNFSGSFENAPATPVLSGSFSFDDAVVAAGGLDGDFALTALSLIFQGQTYTLAQAASPSVTFEGGLMTGPNAAFTTPAGHTLLLQSFFGASSFTYSVSGNEQLGNLSISAVPEPESYALMLAGLGIVGFLARRRKAA